VDCFDKEISKLTGVDVTVLYGLCTMHRFWINRPPVVETLNMEATFRFLQDWKNTYV